MSRSAIRACSARWIAADPRIKTEEARSLVASALNAEVGSIEHDYYIARLSSLSEGTVPLRALVAAFGDGNSSAARSARAKLQLRDRFGRFAWMGGGMSTLISRAGQIFSRTGTLVGQGTDSSGGNFFDVEYADGTLARIPASAGESRKATISLEESGDGYSPAPSKEVTAKDPIIDEADIAYISAPEGFYKDTNYDGPGEKFTDDEHDVFKFDPNDEEAPENVTSGEMIDFNRPLYVFRDAGAEPRDFDYTAQSWSEMQDYIRLNQNSSDKAAGRDPGVIAQLSEEQLNKVADETPEDGNAEEVAIRLFGDQFESSTPVTKDPVGDTKSDFLNAPDGAYIPDLDTPYIPEGRSNQASEDYTDDPAELGSNRDISDQDLRNALSEAISPVDGTPAEGFGNLPFDQGDELVSAEAIAEALKNRGFDPKEEINNIFNSGESTAPVATIPDSAPQEMEMVSQEERNSAADLAQSMGLGDDAEELLRTGGSYSEIIEALNKDKFPGAGTMRSRYEARLENYETRFFVDNPSNARRESWEKFGRFKSTLDKLEKEEPKARLELEEDTSTDLPPLLEGLSDEEKVDFEETKNYTPYLPKNEMFDNSPEDTYVLDPDPFDNVNSDPEMDPVKIANDNKTEDLVDALTESLNLENSGMGDLLKKDEDGEEVKTSVPAEALRDALQLQGEDTDKIISAVLETKPEKEVPTIKKPDSKPEEKAELEEGRTPSGFSPTNPDGTPNKDLEFTEEYFDYLLETDPQNMSSQELLDLESIISQMEGREKRLAARALMETQAEIVRREQEGQGDKESNYEGNRYVVDPPARVLDEKYVDELMGMNPEDMTPEQLTDAQTAINAMEGRERRIADRLLVRVNEEIARRESGIEPEPIVEEVVPEISGPDNVEDLLSRMVETKNPDGISSFRVKYGDEFYDIDSLDNPFDEGSYYLRITFPDGNTVFVGESGSRAQIGARVRDTAASVASGLIDPNSYRRDAEEEGRPSGPSNVDALTQNIVSSQDENGLFSYSVTLPNGEVIDVSSIINPETGNYDTTVTFSDGSSVVLASISDIGLANTSTLNLSTGLASGLVNIDDINPPDLDPVVNEARRLQERDNLEIDDVDGLKQDVVFPDNGKTYTFQVRHTGEGRFNVFIIDDQGNERKIGQRNSPRSALNALAEYAEAVEDGDYTGTIMDEFILGEPVVNEAQDVVPPGESALGGFVRRGINADRDGADGDDDIAPNMSWLDEMRGGRRRAIRGAVHARDQLKKLVSSWDSRGHSQNRPEHRIFSRQADPGVRGPDGAGEEIYQDLNGNIIRVGDIITHNRVGGLVNPDKEAVNIVKAKVLKRGKIFRNNKWNEGYLQVEILESDDPQWVGRKDFLYQSGRSELIEQPDLRAQIEAEDAARDIPENEQLKMDMWRENDDEIYQRFFDIHNEIRGAYDGQTALWKDDRLEIIAAELVARNLTDPGKLSMVLNSLTDNAINNIQNNLGAGEGTHGRVIRAMIANEKARRAAGVSGRITQLPDLNLDPEAGRQRAQTRIDRRQQRVQAARPPQVRQEPATPSSPPPVQAPSSPTPPPPPPSDVSTAVLGPLDTRTRFERFVDAETAITSTTGNVAASPDVAGLVDPRAGQVDPDAISPDATPSDYTDLGWDDARAAGVAEAARNRPSLEALKEAHRKYISLLNNSGDPNAITDAKEKVKDLVVKIYGSDSITLGGDSSDIKLTTARAEFNTSGNDFTVTFAAQLSGKDGLVGSVSRNISFERGKLYAYNAYFRVEKPVTNQRTGRVTMGPSGSNASDAYNKWMENWYIANGIKTVNVSAAGGGGFTGAARWALNNFNWKDSGDAAGRMNAFRRDLARVTNAEKRERISKELDRLQKRIDNAQNGIGKVPTPLQFVMVGWSPGDKKNWFGWDGMVNRSWGGTKDLTPESQSVVEGMGYRDIYQQSRRRIVDQANMFKPSRRFVEGLSNEGMYSDPQMEVLAPFRDEYMEQFATAGSKSLARLSPPARMALQSWVTANIRGDNKMSRDLAIDLKKDLIPLAIKLRDEARAYDVTPSTVSDNADVFAKITRQDITSALNNNTRLLIDGEVTSFTVTNLASQNLTDGMNPTFMLKNTDTGQVFFAKYGGREMVENEVFSAYVAQSLGSRGMFEAIPNNSQDVVIMSNLGDGIRGGSSLQKMESYTGTGDDLSLVDLASIAVLDAVIGNPDRRGARNWKFVGLTGDGVQPNDTVIPLPIDHGIISRSNNTTDAALFLRENTLGSEAILTLMNYFKDRNGFPATLMSPEAVLLAAETARVAIERMQNNPPINVAGIPMYNVIIDRLKNIVNMGRDGA
jgi:hypothetical protein